MPAKPNTESILNSYSMDELLALVKAKSHREADVQLAQARRHLDTLSNALGGKPKPTPQKTAPAVKRGRKKPAAKAKTTISLGAHIQNVLGKKPMSIDHILNAIKKNGFKSKAKDQKAMMYTELGNQVKKKTIKKAGVGKYIKV